MADWNKPDLGTLKSAFPGEVRAIATSAAKMDFSSDTNIPTGALRYTTSTGEVERWSGSAWQVVMARTSAMISGNYNGIGANDGNISMSSGADLNSAPLPVIGRITHLSLWLDAARAGGTVTLKLFKNGSDTGKSIAISTAIQRSVAAITAEDFAAGDYLDLKYSTSGYSPTGGAIKGIAFGHFRGAL